MMRRCIHSLSLGLWPIQLPRRGSLGYVLLFLHYPIFTGLRKKPSPCRGRCPAGADEVEVAFGTMSNNGVFASSTSSVSAFGRSSFP